MKDIYSGNSLLRRIIPAALALAATAPGAYAQLQGSVAVEGEYAPEIIEATKLPGYPRLPATPMDPGEIPFATGGVNPGVAPMSIPMSASGPAFSRGVMPRGYATLSLGSWLNARLDAGAVLVDNSRDWLSARFNYRSTSLFRPSHRNGLESPRREAYRGTLGLDYSRLLGDGVQLDLTGQYGLGRFNYYSRAFSMPTEGAATDAPWQTLNSGAVRIGVMTLDPQRRVRWNVAFDASYFGYRRLPLPYGDGAVRGTRETSLMLEGGVSGATGALTRIGIDGSFRGLLYGAGPADCGFLTLTPYILLQSESTTLRVGIDADIRINADGSAPGSHARAFAVAPDVAVAWRDRGFTLWAEARGGTTPHTMAWQASMDPLGIPRLVSSQPIYTPVDAKTGVDFGPYAGFSFGAWYGYSVTRGVPYGGWYMSERPLASATLATINLHGMEAGLHMDYRIEELLDAGVKIRYIPQHGERGVMNGFDRARWCVDAHVKVTPVTPLTLEVGVNHRGCRSIMFTDATSGSDAPEWRRLADLCNLRFGASWRFNRMLEIGVHAGNLLNQRRDMLPGIETDGLTVAGEIGITF